jgi:cytochrome c5
MTKTIRIVALLSICLGLTGAFAADTKAADAKPAAPAPAAAAKTAPADKAAAAEPDVKKSKSNICHDKTSSGYKQTKNFTGFKTMDECVKSGGRPPKGSK